MAPRAAPPPRQPSSPPARAGRSPSPATPPTGARLASLPDVATMEEQGAKGGFYETRAFAAFAVPSATPEDIAKKLSDALFEAGIDPKVKQLMANYLIKGPLNFEQTNAVFKRDTEVMLAVLKEIGLKPE